MTPIVWLTRLLVGAYPHWQGCAPSSRQRIYFANHTSHLDTIVIWASLPPALRATVRPAAAKEAESFAQQQRDAARMQADKILSDAKDAAESERQKIVAEANREAVAIAEDAMEKLMAAQTAKAYYAFVNAAEEEQNEH